MASSSSISRTKSEIEKKGIALIEAEGGTKESRAEGFNVLKELTMYLEPAYYVLNYLQQNAIQDEAIEKRCVLTLENALLSTKSENLIFFEELTKKDPDFFYDLIDCTINTIIKDKIVLLEMRPELHKIIHEAPKALKEEKESKECKKFVDDYLKKSTVSNPELKSLLEILKLREDRKIYAAMHDSFVQARILALNEHPALGEPGSPEEEKQESLRGAAFESIFFNDLINKVLDKNERLGKAFLKNSVIKVLGQSQIEELQYHYFRKTLLQIIQHATILIGSDPEILKDFNEAITKDLDKNPANKIAKVDKTLVSSKVGEIDYKGGIEELRNIYSDPSFMTMLNISKSFYQDIFKEGAEESKSPKSSMISQFFHIPGRPRAKTISDYVEMIIPAIVKKNK